MADFDTGYDPHRYVGVDPDIHNNALAQVMWDHAEQRFRVEACLLMRVPSKGDRRRKGIQSALAMAKHSRRWLISNVPRRSETYIKAVAVEGQIIVPRSKQRPQDIMHLAMVASQMFTAASPLVEESDLLYPVPLKWKGSTPKIQHQARISKNWLKVEVDRRTDYVIPHFDYHFPVYIWETGKEDKEISPEKAGAQWKHLMDAIGLAMFAKARKIF